MKWPATVLLAVLVVATARSQDAPDPKSDEQRIQGTWSVESWEEAGQSLDADDLKNRTVFFGGPVFIPRRDGKPYQAGAFKLDATETPKTFDVVVREGEGKGNTLLGVYELTNGTLTLCFDPTGENRPASLKPGPKDKFTVIVLRKPKPRADEQLEIVGKYRSDLTEPNGKMLTTTAIVERRGDGYQVTYWKDGKLLFVGTGLRRGDQLSLGWLSAGQTGVSVYKIEKGPKLTGEYTTLGGIGLPGREVLTRWREID